MPNLYNSLLERLEGRQYSHYFSAYCPFDRHQSPALLVFDDGLAKCLSCNKVWSHQQIDRKIGSHFIPTQRIDAVSRVLPRWRKWEQKHGDLEGIVQAAHRSLKSQPLFQSYFKKRKIYEYADEGSLGYLDGWTTFPVYSRLGKVVDIVVRSTSVHGDVRYVVSPVQHGGLHPLFCPDWKKVDESETVYVVFGLIDAISMHLAGLPAITGVTGKSLNVELLKPIGKRFIIIPDEGEESEAHKLANALGWRAQVKEISFPEGTKDCDDIRREYGNTALLNLLGA